VSDVLWHLREADIVGLAGLPGASLGQEHWRSGHVSTTKRRGNRLSGAVAPSGTSLELALLRQSKGLEGPPETAVRHNEVEVEMSSRNSCQAVCTCGNQMTLICPHAAALLYQWINRPSLFISLPEEEDATITDQTGNSLSAMLKKIPTSHEIVQRSLETLSSQKYLPLPFRPTSVSTVGETIAQFSLSELRAIAREYEITLVGLGKQLLMETMIETLSRPDAVRHVVATLTKPQRQLLAALTLAGGSMSDEDLRKLFERFSLNNAGTLQDMLVALQAKLLVVRTSFNHSLQQRLNLSAAPLDISWYIPREIHEALHITLPVTPFDVTSPYDKTGTRLPIIHLSEPQKLLAEMLLVARSLDGSPAEPLEKRSQRGSALSPFARVSADGSLAIPAPEDQPSTALIESLQGSLARSPAFLRFTVRQLYLAGILQKEEAPTAKLCILPDAAQTLLNPAYNDRVYELFTEWMNHASYTELFELQENGLRVRCRATSLNQPELRRGELEQENKEARLEILGLLAQVPLEQWISFSAFARFIYRLHPTFLQRRQHLFPSPHWWIELEEGRPLRPSQISDWLRAESRYLAHLIQGPLYWWGLCDIALSTETQLLAFRLTPLANLLFHGVALTTQEMDSEQAAPTSPMLSVTSDEHLLILSHPANWATINCIEDFAESTGIQEEKLSYCLTPRSLSAAINRGHNPHDLLTLLHRCSPQGDDLALHELLARLKRRIENYGRMRIYTDVSLVQTVDTPVMQQLTSLISLDEQTIYSIHPTLRLLKKSGVDRLQEELKRRGQAPLLHEEG
jgi:hypothetical protein